MRLSCACFRFVLPPWWSEVHRLTMQEPLEQGQARSELSLGSGFDGLGPSLQLCLSARGVLLSRALRGLYGATVCHKPCPPQENQWTVS